MVKKINEKEFVNEAKSGLAVVDFSATWCGPCKMIAPIVEELSQEMGNVNFYNVDVDENQNLAAEYGIFSIPAILVMKDGVKQDIMVGFKPKAALKADIERLLQ